MTMDDIRRMEEETKAELDKVISCRGRRCQCKMVVSIIILHSTSYYHLKESHFGYPFIFSHIL